MKNNEEELTKFNDLVNMFLAFLLDKAKGRHIMIILYWINTTDDLLNFRRQDIKK